MTSDEYDALLFYRRPALKVLACYDLGNDTPRTLLLGYTTERRTWHVYLDDKSLINVLVYAGDGKNFEVVSHTWGLDGGVLANERFVPNKRLYPESCDEEFCRLLLQANVQLPFTTFTADSHARRLALHAPYAGMVV